MVNVAFLGLLFVDKMLLLENQNKGFLNERSIMQKEKKRQSMLLKESDMQKVSMLLVKLGMKFFASPALEPVKNQKQYLEKTILK